jgi:hypothetical protein
MVRKAHPNNSATLNTLTASSRCFLMPPDWLSVKRYAIMSSETTSLVLLNVPEVLEQYPEIT